MLGHIKYLLFSPIMSMFICFARKSKNINLIMEDLHSYNVRWKKSYSLGVLLFKDEFYRNIFYNRTQDIRFIKVLQKLLKPNKMFCVSNLVQIGGGIVWSHPTSTYLNAKKIGKNFSFRQNTTIGNKIDGRNDLVPTIGDNVFVGANVCIIGDVLIGNNVIIGAGCVVTKNIPDNAVVVGNPMRIIKRINNEAK